MPSEEFKVEHVVDNTQVIKALDKMVKRLEASSKAAEKSGQTSKKAAKAATGSFAALEQKLKANERHLHKLEIGSKAFEKQSARVQKLRGRVEELRRSFKKTTTAVRETNMEIGSTTRKAGGLVQRFVAGGIAMAGIHQAASLVTREIEKQHELNKKASDTTKTIEEAVIDTGVNVGAGEIAETKKKVFEAAPELGADPAKFLMLVGEAISAGADDLTEAFAVSRDALQVRGGDVEKARPLVSAALDIGKKTGSDDFKGILGQVIQTQSQVRAVDMGDFFKNFGPAIAAAVIPRRNQDALTPESVLELGSTVSQVLGDQTGGTSATPTARIIENMAEFVPELSTKLDDGTVLKVSPELREQFMGERSFDKRLAMMDANPQLGTQFTQRLRLGTNRTAMEGILSPAFAETRRKAAAGITDKKGARGQFFEQAAVPDELAPNIMAKRRSDARSSVFEATSPRAIIGTAREIFEDVSDKTDAAGVDSINWFLRGVRNAVTPGSGTDAEVTITRMIEDLKLDSRKGDALGLNRTPDSAEAKLLAEAIKELQGLRQEARDQRADLQKGIKLDAPPAQPVENPVPAGAIP